MRDTMRSTQAILAMSKLNGVRISLQRASVRTTKELPIVPSEQINEKNTVPISCFMAEMVTVWLEVALDDTFGCILVVIISLYFDN